MVWTLTARKRYGYGSQPLVLLLCLPAVNKQRGSTECWNYSDSVGLCCCARYGVAISGVFQIITNNVKQFCENTHWSSIIATSKNKWKKRETNEEIKQAGTYAEVSMSDINFKPRFLKPADSTSFLDRTELGNSESTDFVYNRHLSQTIQTQRQRLPIFNNRNHILYLLEKYQTLVLVGETGCGKSTQLPQVQKHQVIIS